MAEPLRRHSSAPLEAGASRNRTPQRSQSSSPTKALASKSVQTDPVSAPATPLSFQAKRPRCSLLTKLHASTLQVLAPLTHQASALPQCTAIPEQIHVPALVRAQASTPQASSAAPQTSISKEPQLVTPTRPEDPVVMTLKEIIYTPLSQLSTVVNPTRDFQKVNVFALIKSVKSHPNNYNNSEQTVNELELIDNSQSAPVKCTIYTDKDSVLNEQLQRGRIIRIHRINVKLEGKDQRPALYGKLHVAGFACVLFTTGVNNYNAIYSSTKKFTDSSNRNILIDTLRSHWSRLEAENVNQQSDENNQQVAAQTRPAPTVLVSKLSEFRRYIYLNIVVQALKVFQSERGDLVIRSWDTSRITSAIPFHFEDRCMSKVLSSIEHVPEIVDAISYDIVLYGEHAQLAATLVKAGDVILMRNVHFFVNHLDQMLVLHDGFSYNRGLEVLTTDSNLELKLKSRIGNFFADNGSPRDAEALLNPTLYVSDAVNEVVTEILIHRRTEESDAERADQLMAEVTNAEQPRDEHQTVQQQTHGMEVEQEADERERITYESQQSRGESQRIQQLQDKTQEIQQSGEEPHQIQQSGEEPHQIQRSGEESHQIERSGEQTQQVQESSDEFGEILKELDSAIEEEFVNSIAVEFDLFARNTLALAEKRTEKKRVTRRRQVESKEQEDAWSSALENMDVMMALLSEYCGLNANEKISAEWFIDALNLYRYMCADQKDDERIEESSTGSVQADTEAGESADVDMQVPSAVPVPLSIGRSLQWNARLTYPKTGVAPVFALECGVCKLWTTLPPLGVCQLWSKTDFSHEFADICPKCLSNDTISQMELDCYFYFTANEEPYGSVLILVPHSLVNFYIGGLPATTEEIVKAITEDKSKEAPKILEEAASSSAVRSGGLAAAATQDGSSNRWLELSQINRSIRRVMMEKYSIRLEKVLVRGCGPHLKVFEVSSLRSKRNHRKSLARK